MYCMQSIKWVGAIRVDMKRDSFPEDGSKKEQIKWFDKHGDVQGPKAIAFCVGASASYVREVLN